MEKEKNASRNGGKKFFSGVVILTGATLIVKGIGVFFKVPMMNLIGVEGMGYFNAAYHFFGLLMVISTAGLPLALSILVSRDAAEGKLRSVSRNFTSAITFFGCLGAVLTFLLYFFADELAAFAGLPKTALALRLVSPAVFLCTVSGSVRGYFQGFEIMYPTAISEIIEALGKLFLGLGFAFYAIRNGRPPHEVAAFAILGLSVGVFLSSLYLVLTKIVHDSKKENFKRKDEPKSGRKILGELLGIALPITLSSAVLSLTSLLDTLIIPNMLTSSGTDSDYALKLYSSYTNLALPMFNFPTSLMNPLALALVPAIVAAAERKERETEERVVNSSLRLAGIIALPCSFGMAVMAEPVLYTLFGKGQEAVPIASPLLSVLSASIFFSGLMTVTNSMLQSYKKEHLPIISLAVGAAVKVVFEIILVGIPGVGIMGAPISTFLCSTAVSATNFFFLGRTVTVRLKPIKIFLPGLLCAALAGFFAAVVYRFFGEWFGTVIGTFSTVFLTALFYLVLVLRSGTLPKDEILLFPFGEKFCRIFGKLKLM